jgi:heme O synthase-like polyprenyltransferase
MPSIAHHHAAGTRLQQFLQITKPQVVSLVVFTAVIGMLLAAPGMIPLRQLFFGAIGIALVAGACGCDQLLSGAENRRADGPHARSAIADARDRFH